MVRQFCVIVLVLASYIGGVAAAQTDQDPAAFVVMNAVTGRLLMQRAAHQKMYPASTTKVATLLYVLNTPDIDLQQKLVVPSDAVRAVSERERGRDGFSRYPAYLLEFGCSSAGLKTGEIITVQDALYGTMLCSGNDAANTLAYYWGKGSIEACVERINRLVQSLGCVNTTFMNPHGLHHPQHVTTAYDLALIAREGMKIPLFRKIVGSASYTKGKTNKQPAVTWQQTNKLLVAGPHRYDRASGVKTGYHSQAKHCLVASGETADRSLIVVMLQSQDRKQMFYTAKKLLERYLSEQKTSRVVVEQGVVQLRREIEGQEVPLTLSASRECSVSFFPSEEPVIRAVVDWEDLRYPVERGQQVGTLRVMVDEQEADRVPLLACEHREMTWRQRLICAQIFLRDHRGGVLVGAFMFAIICGGLYMVRRRRGR